MILTGFTAFSVPVQALAMACGLACEFTGAENPVNALPRITAPFNNSYEGATLSECTMIPSNLIEDGFAGKLS